MSTSFSRKKKHQLLKMQFSDEQIRNQIEDQVRQIGQKDLTQVAKEQLILSLYNQRKQQKKKKKILDQAPGTNNRKPIQQQHYSLGQQDQQEGQIHQPKPNQDQNQQPFQQQFSIRDLGDHIRPITLTRNKIQDLLNSPRFNQLVKGCFVRYLSDKSSANSYMIAQIVGITQGPKQYTLGTSVRTKLLLRLQQTSQSIITLSIQLISNKHPPGGLQIQKWLRNNRNKMPKDTQLKQKLQQHNKLLIQQLSSKQIDNNILKKAKKIADKVQIAKQDIGYLIDFMVMKLHDLQMKLQQLIQEKDVNSSQSYQKIQQQRKQTQDIINKLKIIGQEQKKNLIMKKNSKIVGSGNDRKTLWDVNQKRIDLIYQKVKAKNILLSTYEGYQTVKQNIISMHKQYEFIL